MRCIFFIVLLFITACEVDENSQNDGLGWHPLVEAGDLSSLSQKIHFECRRVLADDLIFYYQVRGSKGTVHTTAFSNLELIVWRYFEHDQNVGTEIVFNRSIDMDVLKKIGGAKEYIIVANEKTQRVGPIKPTVYSSNTTSLKTGVPRVKIGNQLLEVFLDGKSSSMYTENGFLGFSTSEVSKEIKTECLQLDERLN